MKPGRIRWVLFLGLLMGFLPSASALLITLGSDPVLSISDETGSFTLVFSDFAKGTISSMQSVTYRVQANNMAAGTVQAAVSAKLEQLFDGIDLEADVDNYENVGEKTFASLQEAQSGSRAIEMTSTALADKMPGTGSDDSNLDGNLTVTWRARLTADAAAGQGSRFLVVTLKES